MDNIVLAEKLKEEIGGLNVIAAVFHSFNFDPEFFENYILPLFLPDIPFGDNKIQNTILWKRFQEELPPITVYCDFHAKAQKGINLGYLMRPIDIPNTNYIKPCYHPKHSYILLSDNTLLVFIGSNNLTASGWTSNLEGVNFFRLKNEVFFPRAFKDELKEFNRHTRDHFFNEKFNSPDNHSIADEKVDAFFRKTKYTPETETEFLSLSDKLSQGQKAFTQKIEEIRINENKGLPFEKVEVISPFFPKGIELFKELIDITGTSNISFSIPFENTNLVSLPKKLFDEVLDLGIYWKAIIGMSKVKRHRANHSKIYQFTGEKKVFTIVGSINFTNTAWKGYRNGGNYESAVLYKNSKENIEDLLEEYNYEQLDFIGHKEDESEREVRENAFELEFTIDWLNKTLEVINKKPDKQSGYIEFNNLKSKLINESRVINLGADYLDYLSISSLIKVKPSNKNTFFYYYPIHKNIESKPLPANLHLNDAELLELWSHIGEMKDSNNVLSIIDRFIERILDESGDINKEHLNNTHSTLNLMATHLSGLINLHKKIFYGNTGLCTANGNTRIQTGEKLAMYYLFTDNLDTLIGYQKLVSKMHNDRDLNTGFYWLLLSIIDKYFYQYLNKTNFVKDDLFDNVKVLRNEIISKKQQLKKEMTSGSVTHKHLKWLEKMLENDIRRN